MVKKAEAQAAIARRRVQAARLLEEESNAAALEQTATAARQHVPSSSSSSSSPAAASQLVPTASSTYEDTVVAGLHLQVATMLNVQGDCTSCHLWLTIENQFLGNREQRTLHLDTAFHNFVQGDLSMSEYCKSPRPWPTVLPT
jgi:hypothetical protein